MLKKFSREHLGTLLTLILAAVPFLYMILVYNFHMPMGQLHNAAGLTAVALLVVMLLSRRKLEIILQVRWLMISAGIFFGLTIVGQVLGYQSLGYYLSGLNNNGRFFIFFFGCILFLKTEQREKIMKLWDVLFWVNFLLTLYQFFVLGIKWDFLGGIFGTQVGCNAYTNVFFTVSITFSILLYMNQREKAWVCLARCAAALIVTALAELKMFVLEFAGILVLAVLLTKFSRRKLYLIIGGAVGALACIKLMVTIFPWWAGWFSLGNIWETATSTLGYNGIGDWNRLTAIPIAWNEHLLTWPQKLFGLGLGNCDFSPIAGMTSPFYDANWTNNYYVFSSGMIMLETGLIGTIAYVGFFLLVFFAANSLLRSGKGDEVYCQLTEVLALMSLVLYVYNCTLRTEVGYMLYFALALAFMGKKKMV